MFLIAQLSTNSPDAWVDLGDKFMRWGIPASVCLVLIGGAILLFYRGIPKMWEYFVEKDKRRTEIEIKERENRIKVMDSLEQNSTLSTACLARLEKRTDEMDKNTIAHTESCYHTKTAIGYLAEAASAMLDPAHPRYPNVTGFLEKAKEASRRHTMTPLSYQNEGDLK